MSPFFREAKEGDMSSRHIKDRKVNWATAIASTPITFPVTKATKNKASRIEAEAVEVYSTILAIW